MTIINKVNGPSDLKKLSVSEMEQLAEEIRALLLNKVSVTGGHVGPNLGIVEMTLAFHYVFDSPNDKVIWDVSHQSYTHKIVTGRKEAWLNEENYHDVSGYTGPQESQHDFFTVGHTSTSVSLAVGMAKARDLQQKKENIIAVLGDGSLSGGLALEGLNNAAELNSNLIIVLNDNEMSIAENHGGMYRNLQELRQTKGHGQTNLFTALGLDYLYVEEGNDIQAMITTFEKVKNTDKPIVLHIHTEKGHGYEPAVSDKMGFHWHMPFDLETGRSPEKGINESYDDVILEILSQRINEMSEPILAVTAGIPGLFKLKDFERRHPNNYVDVGIAEQHSITFAAGMAKAGAKPVVFHSSTFLQRAYDQLSHDLGIDQNPAVVIVRGGKISGGDPTHQGCFDVPYITSIPGLIYLAPASKEELSAMLNWALDQKEHPVIIRIPEREVLSMPLNKSFDPLKWTIEKRGNEVALLGLGSFLPLARQVQEQLQEYNIAATVINPHSFTEMDEAVLEELKAEHRIVVTLEDGSLAGGYGEKISRWYGAAEMKVLNFGAEKQFFPNQTSNELFKEFHLTSELITQDILQLLK